MLSRFFASPACPLTIEQQGHEDQGERAMEMVMRSYPNDWVASSIMHRKGIGGGSSGATHELTEEKQGT